MGSTRGRLELSTGILLVFRECAPYVYHCVRPWWYSLSMHGYKCAGYIQCIVLRDRRLLRAKCIYSADNVLEFRNIQGFGEIVVKTSVVAFLLCDLDMSVSLRPIKLTGSALAVKATTHGDPANGLACMRFCALNPSRIGICRSSRTRSKGDFSTATTASCPSEADCTSV